MALQVYYDRFHRDVFDVNETINTFDLDFQHHALIGKRNDLVWGFGYRLIADHNSSNSSSPVELTPKRRTTSLTSAFVQDEFMLVKDRLRLTLGSKLEHNEFTGFEVQPNIRLLWTPTAKQTFWAAASRAVRTPSRGDSSIRVNTAGFPGAGGLLNIVALVGRPEPESEELRAYETGYRVQPTRQLSIDIATFYNFYDRLQTFEPNRPFLLTDPRPLLLIPLQFNNKMRGETYGVETVVNWNPTRRWQLNGQYSFLRMQLHPYTTSRDARSESAEGQNPQHQLQFHSLLRLPRNFELDNSIYHVSALPTNNIPAYTRVDARLGWRVKENVELSLIMQNLLDNHHPEFIGTGILSSEPGRGAYGKFTWHF